MFGFAAEHRERLRGEVRAFAEFEVLRQVPEMGDGGVASDPSGRAVPMDRHGGWIGVTNGRE